MSKNPNIKKIKKLKSRYTEERKGFRGRQYEILAATMAVVIDLRSDKSALKEFLELSGGKISRAKIAKTEDGLTVAVVSYVTAAKSESALKLAWKRGRVLDYLHDVKAVSPENLADEIRSRGGIEKIAQEAIKLDPRRAKAKESKASLISKKLLKRAEKHKEVVASQDIDDEDDWDVVADDAGPPTGDDFHITALVSTELRAKLMAIKPNRRVEMIGMRMPTDDPFDEVLEVQSVRVLNS